MKKTFVITLLFAFSLIVSACTADVDAESPDWAQQFIKWNGSSYRVTDEQVLHVKEKLGQVEAFTDDENYESSKTYSNAYPVGTEFHKISDVPQQEAIAVNVNGEYFKLTRVKN